MIPSPTASPVRNFENHLRPDLSANLFAEVTD
jgi:hypothetical protein